MKDSSKRINANEIINYLDAEFSFNNKQVFLSYSFSNKNIVHEIVNKLKEALDICFIDMFSLKSDSDLFSSLIREIKVSSLFICFISKEFCESDTCCDHLNLAKRMNKTILPVMLQPEATNSIQHSILNLKQFLAFEPPNVFEPWSEDLFKRLSSNILDIITHSK